MPFEYAPTAPQKIAVIGAGISGMGAAQLLSGVHDVTLYESARRLGGHARTVIAGRNGDQPVDTGFIVFNHANYPRMTKLFDQLEVPVVKSNMSFGVSAEDGRVEYALQTLSALFAQRRNIVNPMFLAMLLDIARFNKRAARVAQNSDMTLGELLQELQLGRWFRDYYLLPFTGAIWSTPLRQMLSFPAEALIRFFQNHNLMAVTGQHQWYTVKGGSIEYVKRLEAALRAQSVDIRLDAVVQGVRRSAAGVSVRARGGEWEAFDRVVFACHSDEALKMLESPTPDERSILGALRYQDNRAVLHADPSVMPKRRSCWASWIYSTDRVRKDDPVGVTYWMNSLQPIPQDDLLLGSLNPTRPLRDDLIYDETTFRHPVFDRAALAAQPRLRGIQGQNSTWYCGAYMRNGFHEDGYSSAVDVAEDMGMVAAWA